MARLGRMTMFRRSYVQTVVNRQVYTEGMPGIFVL
jgi:hypothetical protein